VGSEETVVGVRGKGGRGRGGGGRAAQEEDKEWEKREERAGGLSAAEQLRKEKLERKLEEAERLYDDGQVTHSIREHIL